jgi:N-methylhydantoinase A/oxoprolinase/acetone carboxylase beta subunit
VVNAAMVEGIRLVSVRRGIDPRRFALVALGGAGPVHATALAAELGIGCVLVPRHPGVLSAAGLLAAPVEHEVAAAFPAPLCGLDFAKVQQVLESLDARCAALMAEENLGSQPVTIRYAADVWYIGQSYYLEVPLRPEVGDPLAALEHDFRLLHDRMYGHSTEAPAAIVNLRSVHRAGGAVSFDEGGWCASGADPRKPLRLIRVPGESQHVRAAIYDRAAMQAGMTLAGPAIIEQDDTTTLVEPGWRANVLDNGTLLLERN